MRGGSDVEVAQDAPCLSQCGEVLPDQLPRGSLSVQNESTAWCVQLGRNGLVVGVCIRYWEYVWYSSPSSMMTGVSRKSFNVFASN